jgi:hypothetical protein
MVRVVCVEYYEPNARLLEDLIPLLIMELRPAETDPAIVVARNNDEAKRNIIFSERTDFFICDVKDSSGLTEDLAAQREMLFVSWSNSFTQ